MIRLVTSSLPKFLLSALDFKNWQKPFGGLEFRTGGVGILMNIFYRQLHQEYGSFVHSKENIADFIRENRNDIYLLIRTRTEEEFTPTTQRLQILTDFYRNTAFVLFLGSSSYFSVFIIRFLNEFVLDFLGLMVRFKPLRPFTSRGKIVIFLLSIFLLLLGFFLTREWRRTKVSFERAMIAEFTLNTMAEMRRETPIEYPQET